MPVRFIRHGYFPSRSDYNFNFYRPVPTPLLIYDEARNIFIHEDGQRKYWTYKLCVFGPKDAPIYFSPLHDSVWSTPQELSRLKVKKELRTVILESKDFHRMSPWGTGDSFNVLMPFSSLEVLWIMLCIMNNAGLEYIGDVNGEVDLDSTSLTRSRSVVQEEQDRIEALFERTKTTHPEWKDPALKFRLDFKFLRERADYRSCVRCRKE